MEVVDANGDYVGLVEAVVGAEVELAEEGDAVGDAHHRIPLAWVDYAWDHKCKLTLTRDEARARWDDRREA
jgi:hypothetical protein